MIRATVATGNHSFERIIDWIDDTKYESGTTLTWNAGMHDAQHDLLTQFLYLDIRRKDPQPFLISQDWLSLEHKHWICRRLRLH